MVNGIASLGPMTYCAMIFAVMLVLLMVGVYQYKYSRVLTKQFKTQSKTNNEITMVLLELDAELDRLLKNNNDPEIAVLLDNFATRVYNLKRKTVDL